MRWRRAEGSAAEVIWKLVRSRSGRASESVREGINEGVRMVFEEELARNEEIKEEMPT